MTIGQLIKKIREEYGMSIEELAKRIGKSRATLYRYENDDTTNIPVSILPLLSKTFTVPPSYFLGWSEDTGIYYDPQVSSTEKTFSVSSLTQDAAVAQTTIYTKNDNSNQVILRTKQNKIEAYDLNDEEFNAIKILLGSMHTK